MTEFVAAFCVLVSGLFFAWAIAASYLAVKFFRLWREAFVGLLALKANLERELASSDLSDLSESKMVN